MTTYSRPSLHSAHVWQTARSSVAVGRLCGGPIVNGNTLAAHRMRDMILRQARVPSGSSFVDLTCRNNLKNGGSARESSDIPISTLTPLIRAALTVPLADQDISRIGTRHCQNINGACVSLWLDFGFVPSGTRNICGMSCGNRAQASDGVSAGQPPERGRMPRTRKGVYIPQIRPTVAHAATLRTLKVSARPPRSLEFPALTGQFPDAEHRAGVVGVRRMKKVKRNGTSATTVVGDNLVAHERRKLSSREKRALFATVIGHLPEKIVAESAECSTQAVRLWKAEERTVSSDALLDLAHDYDSVWKYICVAAGRVDALRRVDADFHQHEIARLSAEVEALKARRESK